MRAGTRMSQERTDLVRRFRRKDVLKLAGLLLDFSLAVHGKAVGEEPFGQPMPPDDAASLFASARRELND